jgi:DNA polymerase II small subunit/DNA polymerase delta subunit B
MGRIRPIGLSVLALAAGLALGACGGSGSNSSGGSVSQKSVSTETTSAQAGPQVDGSKIGAPPLEVSPGGAAQFKVKGNGYRYKQFGREGTRSELVAAAESLRAYLIVLAEERWDDACSYLSKEAVESVESLSQTTSAKTCGGILDAITAPFSKRTAREATVIDAGAVRRDKAANAYLLYRGTKGAIYSIPMIIEDGVWKVGGVGSTLLN